MSKSLSRAYVLECGVCHRPSGPGSYFCVSCDVLNIDPERRAYAATRWARLGAFTLDYLIIWLTVGIGWLVWLAIVAPRGQSPGKALLGLYILRTDSKQAATRHVWLREFGWDAAIGIISVALLALLGAVASSVGEFFPALVLAHVPVLGVLLPRRRLAALGPRPPNAARQSAGHAGRRAGEGTALSRRPLP